MEKGKEDMKENRDQGCWSRGSNFTGGAWRPVFQETGVTLSWSLGALRKVDTLWNFHGGLEVHPLIEHVLSTQCVRAGIQANPNSPGPALAELNADRKIGDKQTNASNKYVATNCYQHEKKNTLEP